MTPKPLTERTVIALVTAITMLSALVGLTGCEVVESGSGAKKQDSITATVPAAGTQQPGTPAVVPESARGIIAMDSMPPTVTPGVTAGSGTTPAESLRAGAVVDTAMVRVYPPAPRRGGVVFALAEGVDTPTPRCTWKSAPIPCYRTDEGVIVTVPLPADEDAGTFTLTIEGTGGRVARQIAVADHDFGRELIFLVDSVYKRATNTREIARDARAIRGITSMETAERRWNGRWREPVAGTRSTAYGVERYYYRASDSTRSIQLDTQERTRGTFAADTNDAPVKGAPSWRHAGVDIPARKSSPIVAPAAGVVADVGDYILSGRTLLIDHGQGVVSAYFHLDTALVAKGDLVRAGQRIGRVGQTGLTTGPHLHYGIYLHGKDVDPVAWRDMPGWLRSDQKSAGDR